MTKMIDGSNNKYCIIQHRAHWAHNYIDTTLFDVKDTSTRENYKAFLREKFINPTATGIAMQDARSKHPVLIDYYYKENIAQLEQEKGINDLVKAIKEKCARIYPKTNKVRELLIEHNCFKLDQVTPKTNFMGKLVIKLEALLKR